MGRRVDKENNKKWHSREGVLSKSRCLSRKFFFVLFSVTPSLFLLGFSQSSHNITASSKSSASRKKPTSVSKITLQNLHKNVIPLLCQCGLFIHTCMSKNSIVTKDLIFYLLWYGVVRWSSHLFKKSSFLSFYSSLVKFSE